MSAENFHLLDETIIDISILKKDFCKIYHQQEVNVNDSDENIDFFFGENKSYYHVFIAYFQIDISLKKNVGKFQHDNTDTSRLVNKISAYFSKEETIRTTRGSEMEVKKICLKCFFCHAGINGL